MALVSFRSRDIIGDIRGIKAVCITCQGQIEALIGRVGLGLLHWIPFRVIF